ncbi:MULTISPECIES: GNAT family N-acetyltransferase [Sphingobacterium]|uniref:GNAT family N-acetyltransferase n=1 Tax=Sphingobacterium TaxID=28453 RepID=UPI0025804902|nr:MULTISPECIES: GNAT family N-acetyltransferase [Sphingobacterium]
MHRYKILSQQVYKHGDYSIVPIRYEDRLDIMRWRNEQIYHLRQSKPLTNEDQDNYFKNTVINLFDKDYPDQILFSYLFKSRCIGYGGLVHINWIDKNAEISFVMQTDLEINEFEFHWKIYLDLIQKVAFDNLKLHKIYTYAFDLRPALYSAVERMGFFKEAILKEHCFFNGKFIDVVIHAKKRSELATLRQAYPQDIDLLFRWANEDSVRNNSFDSKPIVWENHVAWYRLKLQDLSSKIFILVDQQATSVGQIRLDKVDDCWEIDYSIDVNHRGKGYGKLIVSLIFEKVSPGSKLKAVVKSTNSASLSVFRKLGFEESVTHDETYIFKKKINGDICSFI